jgi:hypothetical protein
LATEREAWLEKRLKFLESEMEHKMDDLSDEEFQSLLDEHQSLNDELHFKPPMSIRLTKDGLLDMSTKTWHVD